MRTSCAAQAACANRSPFKLCKHGQHNLNECERAIAHLLGLLTTSKDRESAPSPDMIWRPAATCADLQTNSDRVGDTRSPGFPAYPSGHATMGTAAFATVRRELALPDSFTFKFTSAELDGVARDPGPGGQGALRPVVTRTLSINDAILQNQDSRTYLGVHWEFDSRQGGVLGEEVLPRPEFCCCLTDACIVLVPHRCVPAFHDCLWLCCDVMDFSPRQLSIAET
jgi:hypothetical protein